MKKTISLITVIVAIILLAYPVSAEEGSSSTSTPAGFRRRMEIRNEIKNKINEVKEENKAERKNLLDNLKENFKQKIDEIKDTLAKIIGGEITANTGTGLTVVKDGVTYTVNTTAKTILKRRYWGNAHLSEMAVGDKVNVWGKFTDTDKKTIEARMIRDTSIMKRHGVFIGTVTDVNGNNYTINTVNRGVQTATISQTTKLVNRKEEAINPSDIKIGHKVRVKGMWDQAGKTITEVTQLKDFSIPVIPTPTVKK